MMRDILHREFAPPILETISRYYVRYLAAAEYQKQKRLDTESRSGPPRGDTA